MESGVFVFMVEEAWTQIAHKPYKPKIKGFQVGFKATLRGPVIADPPVVPEGNNKGLAFDSWIEAESPTGTTNPEG